MKTTNIDKNGKSHNSKDILLEDCIFPFKYKHKLITGKRGTMYIIDTGIWHKGGTASNKSRWSLFNYYSPWFVKPYYQYEKMLGEKKSKKISKQIRKLLHYYSTPPINDETRLSTVTRI